MEQKIYTYSPPQVQASEYDQRPVLHKPATSGQCLTERERGRDRTEKKPTNTW